MSTWNITPPNQGTGGFSKEEHLGHRCVFVDATAEEVPKFSGEGMQVASRCRYVICETCSLVLSDKLIHGDALVPKIVDAGEIVAGRLALGQARAGRSAPYLLEDPTDDDVRAVESFLDKYAVRMPSGTIVVEMPPVEEEAF